MNISRNGKMSGNFLLQDRLIQEMNFAPEVAIDTVKASESELTEDNPLPFIVPEPMNYSSFHYWNYGLPVGTPGALNWPGGAPPAIGSLLPPGVVMALPVALGRFVAAIPGVEDLSHNAGLLLRVRNVEVLIDLQNIVCNEPASYNRASDCKFVRGLCGTSIATNFHPRFYQRRY